LCCSDEIVARVCFQMGQSPGFLLKFKMCEKI
jgi:hypothetical protein